MTRSRPSRKELIDRGEFDHVDIGVADHPDHRRTARARRRRTRPRTPGRQRLAAGRSSRRRGGDRNSRPARARQSPSGPSALSVLPVAGGGSRPGANAPLLPVPADDERQTRSADNVIAGRRRDRRRRRPGGVDVGHHRHPEGRDAHGAALIASAAATHRPARRHRDVAARTAGLPHRRHTGAGAQRACRHCAGRRTLPRSTWPSCRTRSAAMGPGRRYASLVAAQLDKALADPCGDRRARRTRRRADRRRPDAGDGR